MIMIMIPLNVLTYPFIVYLSLSMQLFHVYISSDYKIEERSIIHSSCDDRSVAIIYKQWQIS